MAERARKGNAALKGIWPYGLEAIEYIQSLENVIKQKKQSY